MLYYFLTLVMSSTKNTSLEKIGYLNKISEHSNIIDYESIIIKKKKMGINTNYIEKLKK